MVNQSQDNNRCIKGKPRMNKTLPIKLSFFLPSVSPSLGPLLTSLFRPQVEKGCSFRLVCGGWRGNLIIHSPSYPPCGGAFEASSYQSVCVCVCSTFTWWRVCVCVCVCSACTRRHARLCVSAAVCARKRLYTWGAHRFQDSPLQTCRVHLCDH